MSGFAKGTDGKTRTLKNPLEGAVGDIGLDNATFNTLDVSGNTAVGNLFTDGYYYANGVPVNFGGGGGNGNYGDSNVATFLGSFGSNTIVTSGNITAGYFVGDGSQLTGLATVAHSGNYADLSNTPVIPTATSNLVNDSGFITSGAIPSNVSAFTNDAGYITAATANVVSVNGQTGAVNLAIPTATSNLVNDSGFIQLGNLSVNSVTANGNGDLSYNNSTGVFTFTPANVVVPSYGDANVTTLLGSFGSNTIVTTGDATVGNLQANDANLQGNIYGNGSTATMIVGSPTVSLASDGYSQLYWTSNIANVDVNVGNDDFVWAWVGPEGFSVNGTTAGSPIPRLYWDRASGNVDMGNLLVTGDITAANLGTVSALDLDGNSSNVLYGNGVFAPVTGGGGGSYGDSNVATFLAAFGSNTVTTTGNVTAGYFLGNASQVTGLANVAKTGSYSDLSGVPTNLNQFTNGPGYITSTTANVISVNGQTGVVSLSIPTSTSNLINDSGFITSATANVISVNGKTGAVTVTEYSNTAVSTFLATYGSNTISTTGNITAGNIFGTFVSPGSNTQVLFNDAGTIAGDASLTYNKTTGTLTALGVTNTGISAADFGIASTELPNTVASFTANVNNYTQVTFQNKSAGADATADFILTADNGSDTVNYGDFGIINSGYNPNTPTNSLGNIVYAGDTYIYSQGNTSNTAQSGGNLVLGATVANKNIKLFAGGANTNSLIATVSNAGITMNSGNITGNTGGFAIGYRDIPQVSFAANATVSTSDAGKHYYSTSASNLVLTIANNASQAFSVGAAINIINRGTGNITIAQGSGVTIYLAGNTTAGNRTLSSYGAATIQKVETNVWFLVGSGLS